MGERAQAPSTVHGPSTVKYDDGGGGGGGEGGGGEGGHVHLSSVSALSGGGEGKEEGRVG